MSVETNPYSLSAEVYDAIYSYKDYAKEAKYLKSVIASHKQSDGNGLLDFACGTGAHLEYLMDEYEVEGVDLSEDQLAVARKRIPEISFRQGDMRNFDAGESFDVVTCLFSSIGYLYPLPEMENGIANMARHLKPGGVLIVEPWLKADTYNAGHVSTVTGEINGIKVTRIGHSAVEGNLSVMTMEHTVERPDGTENFTEVHTLAMYTDDEYQKAFLKTGLQFELDEVGMIGRGLYIGTKPL